jgi:hypothetical protein
VHRSVLVFVAASLVAGACSRPAAPPPKAAAPVNAFVPARVNLGDATVSLPKQVEEWVRPDGGRRITAETIFDYMDGAGELYVGYRFDHLDVFEYKPAHESSGTILVELYSMKTPEDAFGLLSNDWGGEPVPAASAAGGDQPSRPVPAHRGLYGGGLLRLWSGSLYARVLASREAPASREAVLRIGRELQGTAPPPSSPVLSLPEVALPIGSGHFDLEEGLRISPQRTCFFRSHLVLNSQYFLASEDILGLGLDVEAASTEYRPQVGEGRVRVIAIRYPSAERALAGLRTFAGAYLAGAMRPTAGGGAAKVAKGWVGWAQTGRNLVLTLDAATERQARGAANSLLSSLQH